MGYFALLAGFTGTPVPYRGNAPLMTDLAAGQVQSGFIASAGAIPHVRAGRLKGLAISSAKRSPLAPDVPTTAEAGYPQMKLNTWFVLLAPAKTPPAILSMLEREVRTIVRMADLQEKVARQRHRARWLVRGRGEGAAEGRDCAMDRRRPAREA